MKNISTSELVFLPVVDEQCINAKLLNLDSKEQIEFSVLLAGMGLFLDF